MNQTPETKFDCWCIVELFGHQKIAGKCTEQNIAGTNMLRVDVPECDQQPAFTRLFGSAAIYAINPVDEETARFMVGKLQVMPIEAWNAKEVIKKYNDQKLLSAKRNDSAEKEAVVDKKIDYEGEAYDDDFNNDDDLLF